MQYSRVMKVRRQQLTARAGVVDATADAARVGAYAYDDLASAIRRRAPGREIGTGEGLAVTSEHGLQISRGGRFNIPDEMVRPFSANLDAQLQTKYLWTADKDGLRLIREMTPIKFGRKYPSHTNMSGGGTARAGGEAWFTGTNTVRLNAASRAFGFGHKSLPLQRAEYAQVIRMWRNMGYKVDAIPLGTR